MTLEAQKWFVITVEELSGTENFGKGFIKFSFKYLDFLLRFEATSLYFAAHSICLSFASVGASFLIRENKIFICEPRRGCVEKNNEELFSIWLTGV